MAKGRSTALAQRPQVVVMAPAKSSRRGAIKRHARRAGGALKRAGGAIAKGAWEDKLAISAVGGAGIVGYLEGSGNLDMVPDPLGIGKVPTLAALAYFGGRAMKSPRVRQAGIGLAAAAAFAFGQDKGRNSKK